MDLLQLQHFLAIAEQEHVSRAAARLHVAQPSLSRSLARLEKELGVPLFDRVGRTVRLNALGRVLADRAGNAMAELDAARREIEDAVSSRPTGQLTVACETLLTIADIVADFRDQFPDVQLTLLQLDGAEMAQALADRSVDVCIASQPLPGSGLRERVLRRERVFLAVSPQHRFARRARITVEQAADEPFVITRRGHWQRALLDRLWPGGRIVAETNEPIAVQRLAAAGLGATLLPAVAKQADDTELVRYVGVSDPRCVRRLTLVRRADRYVSTAMIAFEQAAASALRGAQQPTTATLSGA